MKWQIWVTGAPQPEGIQIYRYNLSGEYPNYQVTEVLQDYLCILGSTVIC